MRIAVDMPREVRLIEHEWIEMPDGCRLAARIWLPEGAEADPVPAVLEYIPYRKNDATVLRDVPIHRYFAGHGYASVRVDIRGSGDSEGILEDEYLPLELSDGLAVLSWLASKPWCSGRVGIIGKSWGGFNGLQIAALAPPELGAVISVCSTDDRYADDVHYIGGCVQAFDMLAWASTMLAYNARPPDPAVVGADWKARWLDRLERTPPHVEAWLAHQRRDGYWKHGSVCEDFAAITCPVYMVGGWADGYHNAVLRFVEGHPGPCKGLVGPWGHVYPHDGAPGPAIGFLQEALRWWDCHLKGLDNGIMAEPKLRVYSQEAIRPRPSVPIREGRWTSEPSWPSPNVSSISWFCSALANLGREPSGTEAVEIRGAESVQSDPGPWCGWGGPLDYPADQGGEDGRSLAFTSGPLESPLEILGFPSLHLELSSDVPEALVAARLCDVWPDGASTLITRGVLNLSHRESHESPVPLLPGQRYPVEVVLSSTSYVVPAGHRLRLSVSPTYWPLAWPSPAPATLTVFAGTGCELRLPVRAPNVVDPPVPAHFSEPEAAAPPPHVLLAGAESEERALERDAKSGLTRIVAHSAHFPHVRFLESGLEYSDRGTDVYEITDGDPLSALARCEREISIGRGEWRTRVRTTSTLSADASHFHVTNSLDAFEGGTRVLAKGWSRSIPRDTG